MKVSNVLIALAIAGALGAFSQRADAAQLPIPCIAGSCGTGATSPTGFVTSGKATAVQSGNSLAINQASAKATLNWATFDVSADGKVTFNQPSATSVALNRIFQGNPSAIFGSVSANGQIYLVNPNGFVFGKGATVNAAGLIASSLGISDTVFNVGLLAQQLLGTQTPALQSMDGRTTVVDNSGNPVLGPDGQPLPVQISVQQGATLSTPGGRLLLAAPLVQNAGTLNAPDGQVVLAAGQKVFLAASGSAGLRGLVVEVDTGGTASNQLGGLISAPRGNVNLVGLAVNQDGRISATTSVAANGTVRLEAGEHPLIGGGGALPFTLTSQIGGTVELGAQSDIEILPELSSSATAVKDQTQLASEIDVVGQAVLIHGGSIHAPSGILNVTAAANPGNGVQTDGNTLARIRVDSGTSIDVSGSSVELPMSANLLAIQLRANELADAPAQRSGALRGQTVYVDARVGSPLISSAAFTSAVNAVPELIGQRTTAGGTVTLASEGDVVIQKGATINVSGGKTTYDGGIFQTTLVEGQNRALYDIGTANPLLTYTGVMNPTFTRTFNKWGVQDIVATPGLSHYESGYVQGAPAGTIAIAAPSLVLSGTLVGHAVNGALQRDGAMVSGGQLVIGLPGGLNPSGSSVLVDFLAPSLSFVNQAVPIIVADDAALPPQTVQLPVDYLAAGGFTKTSIFSNATVTVPAGVPLNLSPGGSLSVQASRINVLSNITAPGGSVQLQNALTIDANDPNISRLGIQIGAGVSLDVDGQWTNDSPSLYGNVVGANPIFINGGKINLSTGVVGSELVIGDGAAFHASAGAWLQANGTLSAGTGGSIGFQSGPQDAAVQMGASVGLDAFGVDGAKGGSFSFTAPRLSIADGSAWSGSQRIDDLLAPGGVFNVGTALFDSYGFSSVTLVANGAVAAVAPNTDILTVRSGTSIAPLAKSIELQPAYVNAPTGTPLEDFSAITTLAVANRSPAGVALAVTPQIGTSNQILAGLLDFQAGSSIQTDPQASVSLTGVGGIHLEGTIRAPSGNISLLTQTPISESDPGYLPNLRIELGPTAVLDVSGTSILQPNSVGLLLGKVLPGGAVSMVAQRGSVVADVGSEITVAGTSALLDVPTSLSGASHARHTVPSAGGSLVVQAPESISLLGHLEAHAGVGDYGEPAAGSLEVDLTRSEPFFTIPGTLPLQATFPTSPRVVQLISDTAGTSPSVADSGLAVLGITELRAAGIDSLRLEAGNEILFSSSAPLTLARQIILDAPAMGVAPGVNAALASNYVLLGNALPAASSALPSFGSGNLDVNAAQIDLLGSFVLQGVGAAHWTSSGDITLRSEFSGNSPIGALTLDGNLVLGAARIYPATASSFDISTQHSPNHPASLVDSLTLTQTAPSTGTPLSAGGSVTLSADQVTNAGTLVAPFGSLTLTANASLNLAPGSVTSVSGAGMTIPYGSTQIGGQQWIYAPAGGNVATITGIPDRAVSLSAPTLDVARNATVNLRGGGELYAYEWVPGTGGSRDALGQNPTTNQNVIPGLYAVLPSLAGQFAPFDPQQTPVSGLAPGASIYLSGVAGLPAGTYPLLPARDALTPGAYLVQVQTSGYSNIVPGDRAALPDNTPVIAGYLTFGTTGLHSGGYQGVAVWPGSYGQSLAQYQITDASTYFAALASSAGAPRPPLPVDAGSLAIAVVDGLDFQGNVLGNLPNSGGFSSKIDISAPQLEVTGAGGRGPGISIVGSVMQGWKASQIVLGGHSSADGTTINVLADSVTFDSGAQVSADQVLVVANQSIDLKNGAEVLSTSAASGGSAPSTLPASNPITLAGTSSGGAALLAVSDLSLPIVQRTGGGSGGATISVEHGATVASRGALSLDGPGGVGLAGRLSGAGANWSLASATIGFVGAGSSTDALQINSAVQAQLQNAAGVRLASAGVISLYAPVLLGSGTVSTAPTLDTLTLSAASIVNQGAAGSSIFGAKTLTLEGSLASGPVSASLAPTSAGALSFVGGEVNVGAATLMIGGFQDSTVTASRAVVGESAGGVSAGGNLTITAPVLTALGGAKTAFNSPGTLTIMTPAQSGAVPSIAGNLGGEIDINADMVQVSGSVAAAAGVINVKAAQDINLTSTAVIDAGGKMVTIGGHAFGAEGGNIILAAGRDLTLPAGSAVNVSGAGDAPAGGVSLTAGGAAEVLASFSGHAGTGAQGGSISVAANSLTKGLTPLANALQAGGFTAIDSVRIHTGDLTLSAGSTLAANQLTLVADTGNLEIGGTLTAANSNLRGDIGLFGGKSVVLDPGAVVRADTVGGTGIGGAIELGTTSGGVITLGAGSTLSTTGSTADGTVLIRAPIVGNSVPVTNHGADLLHVRQLIIEPIVTLPIGTTLSEAELTSIESSVDTTIASIAPGIIETLNPSGSLPLVVRAAVDLEQSGSLTLASPMNFGFVSNSNPGWRPGGGPVDLSLRIGGSINVQTTISDGFTETNAAHGKPSTVALTTCPSCTAEERRSASIRLVAGADQSNPDPSAVVAGSGSDLLLAPGALVRTGTGDIDLLASGSIMFGNASRVYTAGVPGAATTTALTSSFSFPTQGGAIRLSAGGDITGAPVQQSVTAWEVREGGTSIIGTLIPTQWGIDLNQFGWNVGSFGGGDVSVTAGGSITTLSAAAADTYSNPGGGTLPVHFDNGGLAVTAAGDIGSSQFFLADGASLLRAGGAFSAVQQITDPATGITKAIGSLIALDDARISLEARNGIVIEAVVNPTAITQDAPTNSAIDPQSYFFTYGGDSRLLLQSTTNDVSLRGSSASQAALMGPVAANALQFLQVFPATLAARALQQDVTYPTLTLYPSDQGQVEVVAGRDLISGGTLLMSDANIADIPTLQTPIQSVPNSGNITAEAFLSGAHLNDPLPALIAAGRDIVNVQLSVPKAADIIAGRDIASLSLFGQNLNATDLTLVSAGRDLIDASGGTTGGNIQVGGPGRLDVLAGRNVTLGFSFGITTVGNTVNPNLAIATGADLTVLAGLGQGPDYTDFVTKVIAPDPTYQQLLITYVESLTGTAGLSYASAATEFSNLSVNQQRPLIDRVFFDQLLISGRQANTNPKEGFSLGYAAIDALFPNSRSAVATGTPSYSGDISLTFSRIYTTNGGAISLFAPGGSLDVGLANAPASLPSRLPSQLGIVAEGAGDVAIYSKGDVNVNSSRIFTLGGGNILIWSNEGSIDAGRGSKSSVSAPPPQVLVDSAGNVTLSFSGAVAGSGIRTIQIDPSVNPGNVDLIAPQGSVNAGDAGIGAAGNINIAAQHVVGLDNIQFGGNSTGVPPQVSNIGVTLSGAASTASSASNASTSTAAATGEKEAAAPLASTAALSWLDVFVTGFGEENCKPDDTECLKRQKHN